MDFREASKPTSSSKTMQYSNKVMSSPSASSVGFYADHVEFVDHPPKQKHAQSYITSDIGNNSFGLVDHKLYSYDEKSIDARAATYISGVQERFRLERFD
ncbi:hypothetical protein ACOSP7_000110 [Xanthoceras sorbifolium]